MIWGVLCALGASLGLVRENVPARAQVAKHRVAIRFHVVTDADEPVATRAFLEGQLADARRIFAPLGIELVAAEHKPLPKRHARLVTRADRDALGRYVEPGVINCMVVASLMDVDEPGRVRRGVHWTSRADRSTHFVILSAISGPYVLAHELGHFFGNRPHSDTPGNLMSYAHTEEVPFLDEAQKTRVAEALARYLASGELARHASSEVTRAREKGPSSGQVGSRISN